MSAIKRLFIVAIFIVSSSVYPAFYSMEQDQKELNYREIPSWVNTSGFSQNTTAEYKTDDRKMQLFYLNLGTLKKEECTITDGEKRSTQQRKSIELGISTKIALAVIIIDCFNILARAS